MQLYSYVVARDFGFAPNPFFGVCTLAACKPVVRRVASLGDWILGTTAAKYPAPGWLVFAMQVSEAMTFDEYWLDRRFLAKRPVMTGSLKQLYGDNFYHRSADGEWIQENSHHSNEDGSANFGNVRNDTQTDRVLIGQRFVYFGSRPRELRTICPEIADQVVAGRGHVRRETHIASAFQSCLERLNIWGVVDFPRQFRLRPIVEQLRFDFEL